IRSVPSRRMEPCWGWYTPLRQLKIEVLPAPLGPMMAKISPGLTSKVTSSSARKPPKDRKSTRLNSSHECEARMQSSAGDKKHQERKHNEPGRQRTTRRR